MQILRYQDRQYPQAIRALLRKATPVPEVASTVREILESVRARGDAALLEYTAKFGGPTLKASSLREKRKPRVAEPTARAIEEARRNVHAFATQSLRKDWKMRNPQGAWVGERFDPFQRVGIYVPGGTAPLVSTAVMTVTLAAAAGVPEIVVATPADTSGKINDALLYALHAAGATEIYKIGGAQAIAALAIGTKTIAPVQKIAGPGNAYVVEAKRQVFGEVAIDLLPGPSEIFVIADAAAHPAWIAADLLAQAEHGKGSGIVLATPSAKQLGAVEREIERQCDLLSRKEHLQGVLRSNAHLVLVRSMSDAIALCNAYAPEHVSIATANPEDVAAKLTTSGAIFLGGYSPVAAGDFLAGPSHTLPTGGGGKSFPGLMADMFQRRTSWVQLDASALRKSLSTIEAFSALEGLDAHGRSASIRLEAAPAPAAGKASSRKKAAAAVPRAPRRATARSKSRQTPVPRLP
ncbi:MAG: Histidinol dehydrogenase [Verrucomicrobiota bacterium]|jgi:histidinol dehydrogenase